MRPAPAVSPDAGLQRAEWRRVPLPPPPRRATAQGKRVAWIARGPVPTRWHRACALGLVTVVGRQSDAAVQLTYCGIARREQYALLRFVGAPGHHVHPADVPVV